VTRELRRDTFLLVLVAGFDVAMVIALLATGVWTL
jgi:hypothetical protein